MATVKLDSNDFTSFAVYGPAGIRDLAWFSNVTRAVLQVDGNTVDSLSSSDISYGGSEANVRATLGQLDIKAGTYPYSLTVYHSDDHPDGQDVSAIDPYLTFTSDVGVLEISPYTDANKVRSSLGVTSNELTDDMLRDIQLDQILYEEFDSAAINHEQIKTDGEDGAATADQKRALRVLRLTSTSYCVFTLLKLPAILATPWMNSDGQDEYRRFSSIDFGELRDAASADYNKYLAALIDLTEEEVESIPTPTLFSTSGSNYNPVTGTDTV